MFLIMSKPIRIATVKATGERYVVINIDFQQDIVHCWGETHRVHSRGQAVRTRHEGKRRFPLLDVDIKTVSRAQYAEIAHELFQQAVRASKRAGDIVTAEHTRNPTIIGKRSPKFIALAAELGIDLATASRDDISSINGLLKEGK